MSAPCSHRSGVPAVSQISMDVTVPHVPVDVHVGVLLDAFTPDALTPNVIVVPPAVYPGHVPDVASVPFEVFEP